MKERKEFVSLNTLKVRECYKIVVLMLNQIQRFRRLALLYPEDGATATFDSTIRRMIARENFTIAFSCNQFNTQPYSKIPNMIYN